MAESKSQLNIVISAKDEASAAIKGIKDSNESLSKSVLAGVASWDILKEAIGGVTSFVKSSIGAYLDAQKSLDLVKSTVTSMGVSFDAVQPQFEAFGQKMVRLGVDGEDSQLAMAKLAKAAGNDIPKGMQLAKLASDLAASGIGDLNSNVDTFQSILAGKATIAMRQYKLNLSDTATTADIFNAIQGKVTQTTEDFADTVPGKIKVVQASYKDLQQEIGKDFVDAVTAAIGGTSSLGDILDSLKNPTGEARVVIFELVQGVNVLINSFIVLGKTISIPIIGFDALGKAIKGDFTGAMAEAKSAFDQSNDAGKSFKDSLDKLLNPTQTMAAAEKELSKQAADAAAKHQAAGKIVADVGAGIKNTNKSVDSSNKDLADSVDKLKDSYTSLKNDASRDLADLADSHKEELSNINASIASTTAAIAKLNTDYGRTQTTDTSSIADEIVASEQKVADLKKQLAAETDLQKQDDLKKQLAAEQANLDSSAEFAQGNQQAIDEARRRASLTQLQRDIEDYKNRRALAAQEYQDQLAQLQQELNDEYAKRDKEIALYNERSAAIGQILAQADADFARMSDERFKVVKDEVDKEIALFQQLAQAISNVKSGSSSSISVSTASLPHRAAGGPVNPSKAYIVGENGPELFQPAGFGSIIPNHQLGGGQGAFVVNINGGTYLSEDVAQKIGDKIINQFRRKVGKF